MNEEDLMEKAANEARRRIADIVAEGVLDGIILGKKEVKMKVKKSIEVTIIMTEKEAQWLKDVMQNPLSEVGESGQDEEMRKLFFEALVEEDI